jgi:GT2 family glycosyltransferase
MRVWGEALGGGTLPLGLGGLGELVLDDRAYEAERHCDWLAGSFMLVRAEALAGAGYMDERFFLYSEETDFCLRVTEAGWQIVYSPTMTILHHAGKAGVNSKLLAQSTFARKQYADKHFGSVGKRIFGIGLAFHYLLRMTAALGTPAMRQRHRAARRCARISVGLEGSPFSLPSAVAVDRVHWPDALGEIQELPEKGRSIVLR